MGVAIKGPSFKSEFSSSLQIDEIDVITVCKALDELLIDFERSN